MLPQLDPTWYASQLFWLVVSVVIMHLVLKHVLLPRLMGAIGGRETFKSVAISEAESFKRSAEEARLRYEQTLADARSRSQAVFAEAELAIRNTAAAAEKQMEQTVSARVKDAESTLRTHTDQLKKELEKDVGDLVADIVERFSGARPDGTKTASAIKALN